MNIIYLSNSTIPSRAANNIQKMKMCQAFIKNGHSIELIVNTKKTKTSIKELTDFYEINETFDVYQLLKNNITKNFLTHAIACGLQIRNKKPDLVYSRFIWGSFFTSILSPYTPSILEVHAPPPNILTKQIIYFLLKSKSFKKLVVISDSLKKYYVETYNIPPSKIIVAHDGADEQDTSKKMILSPSNKIHIGYIGHLYPGKGMEIISSIAPKCPWALFHIVGGTENDINFWKNKTKSISNIKFHGFIEHSKTNIIRNSCDILIAPYQKKVDVHGGGGDIGKWMSPLKIFEYMAAGKPIVCSNLPVLKEVLKHKKNALLCNPENKEEWIQALQILKTNKTLVFFLSQNTQKEFKQKYTWKARVLKILRT